MNQNRINVTQTFIPKTSDYLSYLQRAFDSKWLTNRGQLTIELEKRLSTYLNVENILITNNGTIPLQIALKLLGNSGEIITTPFSYVATTSSILWEQCTPVFVDIDIEHLTIDENKIEAAITEKTTAILATHVFGNPCNVLAIEAIAKKHNLKVIYDAAHCFGVEYNEKSLFNYGDISTCSFHATKIFHTGEGGAIFANDYELNKQIYYTHNFGHNGPLDYHCLGINGKISELQSAMGLAVLDNIETIFNDRKAIVEHYKKRLNGDKFNFIRIRENTKWNYSYFCIILPSEKQLLEIESRLNEKNIFPRRYFYPALNTIKYINGPKMPIAEDIASRILCLPLYSGLNEKDVDKICSIILNK